MKNQASRIKSIVLFDGICHLCHGLVKFIVRWDRQGQFVFAPLQSEVAQDLLEAHGLSLDLESFVLIEGERVSQRSTAALRLFRLLGGGWVLLYGLILMPRPWRDGVYDWVARHRYRFFGKDESCLVPTAELMDRFLK